MKKNSETIPGIPAYFTYLLSLAMVLIFFGCNSADKTKLVFAVGGAPAELDFWEKLIEEFEKKSGREVEIRRQPTDSDQRRQGLVISLKGQQDDPDVFLMDVAWIAQFAASNWLHPLDEASAPMEEDLYDLDPENFFPSVVTSADMYEGKLIALPVYIDAGLLYYRKDLLEKYGYASPPDTWDQLVSQSRFIQEKMREENPDFYGYVWQGKQYEGLICNFLEVSSSAGGGLPVKENRVVVETRENIKALNSMIEWIHSDSISPPSTYTEMDEEAVRTYFQNGSALFERNWPYAWSLHQQEGSPVAGKIGIAPLPHFPKENSAATLGGWHVGISAYTDMPEGAYDLVNYILSPAVQTQLALELGWNPGRKEVYSNPKVLEKMPHFTQLRKVFENAVARPGIPWYTQVSEILQKHVNASLSGKTPPQQALKNAQEEINTITERYVQK